jgi:hypothetical protein
LGKPLPHYDIVIISAKTKQNVAQIHSSAPNMENYEQAHLARLQDAQTLLEHQRSLAAAHLGGIAVECRLKALALAYHEIEAWNCASKRRKDARSGQKISNPGHGLLSAIRLMEGLYKKALADRLFIGHLNQIMFPTGASDMDYITLRYSADELADETRKSWQQSLDYVIGWLKKNEALL